jgi:hypothetical protein
MLNSLASVLLLFASDGSAAGGARPEAHALGLGERPVLARAADRSLAELRAAGPARVGLPDAERAVLRAANERDAGLEELRAGELNLSDRDVKIILITAGVVLLLVLIF